jgi:hypothetical protein
MGGDLRRDPFPDFERTIPIGRQFRTRNGGEAVLLSIDLWSDRIMLHFAYEVTTPRLMGREGQPQFIGWSVTDDLGTSYRWGAGGGGGSDGFHHGYATVRPGVPDAANKLVITTPELSEPIEVQLAP